MKTAGALLPILETLGMTSIRSTLNTGREIVTVGVDRDFAAKHGSGYYDGATPAESMLSTVSRGVELQKKVWDKTIEWCGVEQEEMLLFKL